MTLSKEDWRAGMTEDTNREAGCSGCLLIIMACLMVDALVVWGIVELVLWLER